MDDERFVVRIAFLDKGESRGIEAFLAGFDAPAVVEHQAVFSAALAVARSAGRGLSHYSPVGNLDDQPIDTSADARFKVA